MTTNISAEEITCRANQRSKYSLFLIFCVGISACTSQPVEWIDVPLAENVYFEDRPEYLSDQVVIPVPANSDLEYMLEMKQGYSVSYEWLSIDVTNPELLLAEFHGHTIRTSDEPGNVMFYKQGRGNSETGYLVAPFDGEHGWYFSNESDMDLSITLTLSGYYTIP